MELISISKVITIFLDVCEAVLSPLEWLESIEQARKEETEKEAQWQVDNCQ